MNTVTKPTINDADIKNSVLAELKYEPSVKSSDIGVLVHNGTVTLNGCATSYWEKLNAVRAAKRVAGVNGIADEIEVKLPSTVTHSDSDIASSASHQLKWSPSVPEDAIKVTVHDGWITLEGDVEWWYQKNAAENATEFLYGVKGVHNHIHIKPTLSANSIEKDIESAFKRSAVLDANEVAVSTSGSQVTLRGKVRTHGEKFEAERAAWAAPGVNSVKNELTVNWSWLS
jgi:osmotically-inducible protein OsmY